MTRWRCLAAVVVALVVFDTPSAADRSEGQPPRSSATALIVGQVVDAASGKPVAAAAVSLSGAADTARGAGSPAEQRLLTGADGRFVFRDLPAGNFTITSSKLGYVDGASGRRRPGGPSQAIALGDGARAGVISVRMWKVGAIVGTVIDEAAEPLVNVQVRAFRRVTLAGRTRFVNGAVALTDDRGMYRLGNLLPGEYIVAAIARQLAVPLVMAQELQNRVFPGTASIGPPPSLPGTAASTQLGDTVFSLGRGVPIPAPADGRLFVYPPTFYPSVPTFPQATSITVASGQERSAIDLQLQPLPTARVSGVVIGPEGPATALTLRLFPTTGEDVALDLDAPVAITSRTGAFAFPAVPAGNYSLRTAIRTGSTSATPPTDTTLWADLRLAVGGSDIDGLAIALQPGVRVSGRLEFEGAGERPVAGRLQQVPILIEPADAMPGRDLPTIAARVGADGQFTSAGLKPGKYVVRVGGSPTGWMFKSAMYKGQEVADEPFDLHTADALDVVIRFTDRWTGLRGVVQSARGSPDGDATVLVYPVDRQAWTDYGLNGRRVRSVRTGRSGEYSLHSLPQGDYYVVAIPDDRAGDWQDTQFLEALTPVAARIAIGEGDQKMLGLRTRDPR